jgi:hypothetical protein
MAFPSVLPRGSGVTRRGFDAMIRDIIEYYPKAFEEAYVQEIEIIIKGLIDTTPIDTGAAAGVTSNSVGSKKRNMYAGHAAGNADIGNNPGDTGWQLEVKQTSKMLKMSIVNPQWDSYLKYLELGLVQPVYPGKPHFVFDQVQLHHDRRSKIQDKVRRGRSN